MIINIILRQILISITFLLAESPYNTCIGQKILDSCFTSAPTLGRNFKHKARRKPEIININTKYILGVNAGLGVWNIDHWQYYREDSASRNINFDKHPLNCNVADPRNTCIFVGFAYWKEILNIYDSLSLEYVCLKLDRPIKSDTALTFTFTYLTNGIDETKSIQGFAPLIFTNSKPTLANAHYVGRMEEAGRSWSTHSITWEVQSEQSGDTWLIIHPGPGEQAGVILSPCAVPFIPPIDDEPIQPDSTLITKTQVHNLLDTGIFILDQLQFKLNSSVIEEKSYPQLDELVQVLMEYPSIKIIIVGHTDSSGSSAHNLSLSMQRAGAVFNYLVSKNIAAERMRFVGKGSEAPLVPNSDEDNKAKNRRVEIIVEQ